MSGGGGSTNTVTKVEIPKEFQPFVFEEGGVLPRAVDLEAQGGLVPGPVVGDITQQSQQQLLNLAGGAQSVIDPVTQNFLNLQQFDSVNDPRLEAVAQAATRPITESLERQALPQVQDAAIQAGQFGGTRQGVAEGVLRAEADKNIGDIRSQIFFNALQDDLARKERGVTQAGTLLNLQSLPAQITGEVGAAQDAVAQQEAGLESANLLRLSQLIQGFIPGANQTTSGDSSGPSKLATGAGGALAGAAAGAQIGAAGGPIGAGTGAAIGAIGGLLL